MNAYKTNLLELISGTYGKQFVIPIYQRNYTWNTEHVDKLLNDIDRLLQDKDQLKDEDFSHFLGTVIYLDIEGAKGITERSIVDGQQRIVTMFLMLYALRNIAKNKILNDKKFEQFRCRIESYLENGSYSNDAKYRLRPSSVDSKEYELIISGEYDQNSRKDCKSRLTSAYTKIYEKFASMINNNGYEQAQLLHEALGHLSVVHIALNKKDNAQQIFESINSTGVQLSYADLIRNFIMMERPDDIQKQIYNEYWQHLEQLFDDSKRLTRFLRLYLISKTTEDSIKQGQIDTYQKFRVFWEDQINQGFNFWEILNDLKNYSKHYENLHIHCDDDYEFKEEVKDYGKLDLDSLSPFTMDVLENCRIGNINVNQAKKVMQMLVSYVVRLKLNQMQISVVAKSTPFLLRRVKNALKNNYSNYCDICAFYLTKSQSSDLKALMPDDYTTTEHAKSVSNYTKDFIRFILDKLETYNNPIPFDPNKFSKLSIEHLMPQTPNKEWKDIANCSDDQYKFLVNLLGNLTLSSDLDNIINSNRPFREKKEVLSRTGHLRLNNKILNKEFWGPKTIKDRTDDMLKELLKIYKYPETKWKPEEYKGDISVTLNFKGTKAQGIWQRENLQNKNALLIKKGSQIFLKHSPKCEEDWPDELRGVKHSDCKDDGKVFFCILEEDKLFKSPSAAAKFLTNTHKNGWNYWKDEYGNPINNLREKRVSKKYRD